MRCAEIVTKRFFVVMLLGYLSYAARMFSSAADLGIGRRAQAPL
jgi:hypothetical protein